MGPYFGRGSSKRYPGLKGSDLGAHARAMGSTLDPKGQPGSEFGILLVVGPTEPVLLSGGK